MSSSHIQITVPDSPHTLSQAQVSCIRLRLEDYLLPGRRPATLPHGESRTLRKHRKYFYHLASDLDVHLNIALIKRRARIGQQERLECYPKEGKTGDAPGTFERLEKQVRELKWEERDQWEFVEKLRGEFESGEARLFELLEEEG